MDLPQEAVDRRARSWAVLSRESVPFIAHLPVLETSKEAKQRPSHEVANRALSLIAMALKGEGLEQSTVEDIVLDYELTSHLTPKESAFFANPDPAEKDTVQFSWRYESAWVLLWALNYVEELGSPSETCDVPDAVGIMKERTAAEFLSEAKERSMDELLDEADLIYRYHWAVVDARLKGKPTPAGLNPGVVLERHYALNWLIGYMGQPWDDVGTDT